MELAAVGISASVFNLVSKLFNVPLLNVTTSFVAEEQALEESEKSGLLRPNPSMNRLLHITHLYHNKANKTLNFSFFFVINFWNGIFSPRIRV